MLHHNNYKVVQATLARWLAALKNGERDSIRMEPDLLHLQQAEKLMFLTAMMEVTVYLCTTGGQDAL